MIIRNDVAIIPRAIPIINENDSVSTTELQTTFGDNDHLAALVATILGADALVLLSDVEGLFDQDPKCPEASRISTVRQIDSSIEAMVHDCSGGISKGGMASKLKAAAHTYLEIWRRIFGTTNYQPNSLKYYLPLLPDRPVQGGGVMFHLRQSLRIFTCILASGGLRPPDRPVLGGVIFQEGVIFQGIRLILCTEQIIFSRGF